MVDVEEIKKRIDIVQFIGEYLTLKKGGITYKGLCPFHSEKTPSFTVSPERNSWHCFGCSEGGDVITFLQKIENLEFKEAIERLANRAGIEIKPLTEQEKVQKSDRALILEVLNDATSLYHELLLNHPIAKDARTYLEKRGLDAETISKFKIGYAPNSWHTTESMLSKKRRTMELGVKSGLAIQRENKSGFYDRFRGRIMFPIDDAMGKIVGFTGRIIESDSESAKYLNTSETPVFHKSEVIYALSHAKKAIKEKDLAVLMEGQMDVITAHQFGFTNTIATSGTAITREHLNLIKRYSPNVALAFDSDAAGIKASQNAVSLCFEEELNPYMIAIPFGKDPDECIRHDKKLWETAVNEKVPAIEYLIDYYIKIGVDNLNALGKKKVVQQVLTVINKVKDPVEQLEYIRLLANKLGLPETVIMGELQLSNNPNEVVFGERSSTIVTQYHDLERQLIGLLITYYNDLPTLPKIKFENEALGTIYVALIEAKQKGSDVEVVVKTVPPDWQKRLDALVLETIRSHESIAESEIKLEIEDTLRRLSDRERDSRIVSNAQAIAAAFAAGDKETARRLLKNLDSDTINKE